MNNITKLLFVIVLLLAVLTGVLAWIAFGIANSPEAPTVSVTETIKAENPTFPATVVTETTQITEATETVPETTEPPTELTETEAPETEPAWEPQKLTQADFAEKLSDLTDEDREVISRLQCSDYTVEDYTRGDIGQNNPQFANLDLDKDGKTDSIHCVDSGEENAPITFELHLGNGAISPLNLKTFGAGISYGFYFSDINGTGKDDILFVLVNHSTAGDLLDFALFTDSGGRYYRQQMPNVRFTMEDLHNDYVLLSCSNFPYREVMLIGGTGCHNYLEDGQSIFDFYFGWNNTNGKVDEYKIRDVKIEGKKLIILYDFLQKAHACITSNPFGVVYRLESGGYFNIERAGTDVIRDYWLPATADTTLSDVE